MHGFLNVNKPSGWTSRDVVNRVTRIVGRNVKCGHAGTLDPIATGVLLVCLGKATKLVPLIHQHRKSYLGEFLFGKQSPTEDVEGDVTDVPIPDNLTTSQIEQVLPEFIGCIPQIPPAFSAIKIRGKRAYRIARQGQAVELAPRDVEIFELQLVGFQGDVVELNVTCGSGTYLRSLGRDIARRLGTESVMSKLTRTRIGPFELRDAVEIEDLNQESLPGHLQSPLTGIPQLPQIEIDERLAQRLRWGQRLNVPVEEGEGDLLAAVDGSQSLVAIVKVQGVHIAPEIVFPETQF